MVATVSMEEENLNESISTCRFAQRVACVTNQARKNEEIDDKSMIKRLRKRIAELETEIALLKASQGVSEDEIAGKVLSDDEKETCAKVVKSYLAGKALDPISAGITTPLMFKYCFKLLKKLVVDNHNGGKERRVYDTRDPSRRPISNTSHISTVSQVSNATSGFDETMSATDLVTARQHQRSSSAPAPNKRTKHQDIYPAEGSTSPRRGFSAERHRHGVEEAYEDIPRRKMSSGSGMKGWTGDSYVVKPREPYKTPHEKKMERSVRKLNDKVESKQRELTEQRQHLEEFEHSIKEQQLEIIINELRNKLEVTQNQIADQHAYLQRQRKSGCEPELIEQEKLVLRQLKKREAKMEKRLYIMLETLGNYRNKMTMKKQEIDDIMNQSQPMSLEQKFGPHTYKRDGKLNARQVKEYLASEEKMTEKLQSKIDKQRVMTISKQIEVKEAATRQKLADFKRRLTTSKSSETLNLTVETDNESYSGNSPVISSSAKPQRSKSAYEYSSKSPSYVNSDGAVKSTDDLNVEEIESGAVDENTLISRNTEAKKKPRANAFAIDVQALLAKTVGAQAYNNQLHNGATQGSSQKSIKTSSNRWDNAYSGKQVRPESAENVSFGILKRNIPTHENYDSREEILHRSQTGNNTNTSSSKSPGYDDPFGDRSHNIDPFSAKSITTDPFTKSSTKNDTYFNQLLSMNDTDPSVMGRPKTAPEKHRTDPFDSVVDYESTSQSIEHFETLSRSLEKSNLEPSQTEILYSEEIPDKYSSSSSLNNHGNPREKELSPHYKDGSTVNNNTYDWNNQMEAPGDFDSALNKMLTNNESLTVKAEHYDQFARNNTKKPHSSYKKPPSGKERDMHQKSPEIQNGYLDNTTSNATYMQSKDYNGKDYSVESIWGDRLGKIEQSATPTSSSKVTSNGSSPQSSKLAKYLETSPITGETYSKPKAGSYDDSTVHTHSTSTPLKQHTSHTHTNQDWRRHFT
ncbi:unnamed protein product, partial [Owenia fusiformis]